MRNNENELFAAKEHEEDALAQALADYRQAKEQIESQLVEARKPLRAVEGRIQDAVIAELESKGLTAGVRVRLPWFRPARTYQIVGYEKSDKGTCPNVVLARVKKSGELGEQVTESVGGGYQIRLARATIVDAQEETA